MNQFIPVNQPLLRGNEWKYLKECIESGWISSEGPFVTKFEEMFAASVKRLHGIAVTNGSAALDAAVRAIGITGGDEVIMPTFTIISCASAVVSAGGVPVLVDSDPVTWNMSAEQIERKITKKTKAIMVVHIYGLPVDVAPILEIARKYGLRIIEDAAEMHGQTYNGEPCGSFGDVSIFSFYANKHLTTGEGGMIVTDDVTIAERARSLRNLCFMPAKRFVHEDLGWNLRMTNIQAALGVAQLEQLTEFAERKRRMGRMYTEQLSGMKRLQLPLPRTSYAENIYWVYGIVLPEDSPVDAPVAMKYLAERNIGTRPFFWPMHEQPVFRKMGLYSGERYPVAERLARKGFYVPSGMALEEAELMVVVAAVKDLYRDLIHLS